MSRFWLMPLSFGKVLQVTPNDLDMLKVTNTNMHATYTPEDQIFIRFALRWAEFELHPNFEKKVHWMTPKWSWHVQDHRYMHMLTTYTPRPKFSSVSFCDEPQVFELWPNIGKSAPNDPQITLTCSRLKAHICILHASSRLKYSPFRSKMSRFRVTPFFPEKCT